MILSAVRAGRIEDLITAIEWNELPPDVADNSKTEPIAHLKSISKDGEGREILAALANLLALPPAKVHQGRDLENNAVYVWPYLAEAQLDKLTPEQEVDLYRLLPFAEAIELRQKARWTWWRLAIGADGTWHTFRRAD